MTAFTFAIRASDYGAERFAPGAFYGQVGQNITVNLPDGTHTTGTLRRVQIIGDRTTAELTLEVDPPIDLTDGTPIGAMSSGFNAEDPLKHFGPGPDRIEVTYKSPVRPTYGELGWPAADPATTEKQIEAASAAIRERAAKYFESDARDLKSSWARTGDWGNGQMEADHG